MSTKKIGSLTLDGKTYAILLGTAAVAGAVALILQPDEPEAPPTVENDVRSEVVKAALSQVGLSDPAPYWKATYVIPLGPWPKDWCVAFVLWALGAGGAKVDWKIGDKNWYTSYHLPTTKNPFPGDVAYFARNQHHAIVESIDGDNIHLINGNGAGGKVTRSTVQRSQVTVFYSIVRIV